MILRKLLFTNLSLESSILLLKVRSHYHILATNMLTNLLTKSHYKQMSHICVLFLSQKFVSNQIGLLQTHPGNFKSKFVIKFVAKMWWWKRAKKLLHTWLFDTGVQTLVKTTFSFCESLFALSKVRTNVLYSIAVEPAVSSSSSSSSKINTSWWFFSGHKKSLWRRDERAVFDATERAHAEVDQESEIHQFYWIPSKESW
jgi:hypothetical protein